VHALTPIVQLRELPPATGTSIKPRWRRVALLAAPIAQLPVVTGAFDISPGFEFLAVVIWLLVGPASLVWAWRHGLRSRIHVGPAGVRVVNPAWTTRIPWSELAGLGVTDVERGKHLAEPYRGYCIVFQRRHRRPVTATYPCCREPEAPDLVDAYRAVASAIDSATAAGRELGQVRVEPGQSSPIPSPQAITRPPNKPSESSNAGY
jgi:Bacterial PH domain